MEDILSLMNFDEGIALPIANEDNKKLESAIETRQREISKLRDDVDRFASRIQSMTDHLKNVRQERLQTQELCNAREREIKTEEHFRQLAEREEGRLKSEIKRLEKEISENKESKNTYENNIFKGVQRIESMKVQMDWDQNALEAWLKESAKQDEDSMIIHKYAKDDQGKIKQLSLAQEKLIEDRAQRRKSLENEITRTLTSQLELDKVSETFREAHIVRQELLKQWESTIEQMRKRDTEMNDASLQLMELKFQLKTQHYLLKEQQQFLENELNNNNEKGKKISASERQGAKLRLTYQDAENTRIQYQDELETLKYTVDRTAKDLDNARKEVNELKMEIAARKEKLDNSRQMNDELGEQLRLAENTQMTAEERAHMLENMCKKEEQNVAVIEKNLAKLRDVQFKKTQELYQINQTEVNLNVEIQGAKAASRNLSSKLNKLDVESLKQQEIVYNQDFQIQQLERKITRLQGERTNDEKVQLEKRIKEMSGVLEGHQTKHTMLTSQLKKLDDDLRRANRDLEKCSEEDKGLDNKIGELNLYNESSERELKKVTLGKQQLMVEENIHKLEIKRLRDQLHGRANQVLSLEEKRLLLDTAMKERRQEINIHNAMLKAQIKSDEEERQSISMELHERISKIEKLRKRYEILMISMAPPEGEEERSQAYYVIKAAQEKEELQRKGDDLNAKIRKAEKEIMALENTLRLMDSRNETFRKSHAVVNETSEEYEEKLRLEETYRVAQDKCKYKRRRLKELEEDLTVMRQTADGLSTEELQVKSLLEEKSRFRDTILKEIDGQEKKRDRANKTVNRLTGECRSARKTKQALPEEQDINVRAMKELNRNVLKKFAEVLSEQSDIVPIVNMYLEEAGISMPTPSPSQSSRASSVGSFRSNLSSSRSSVASVDQGKREVLGTASLDLMDSFRAQNTPASVQRAAPASRKSTPTHSRPQSRHSPTKSSPTKRTPSREGRVLPGAQGSCSRISTASSTRSSGRKT